MTRTTTSVDMLLQSARESMTVQRVFGQAYERGGVTVIPVARVRGGIGVRVTPAGVYVLRDGGKVSWEPALDLNRVILAGQVLAGVALVVLSRALRHRR